MLPQFKQRRNLGLGQNFPVQSSRSDESCILQQKMFPWKIPPTKFNHIDWYAVLLFRLAKWRMMVLYEANESSLLFVIISGLTPWCAECLQVWLSRSGRRAALLSAWALLVCAGAAISIAETVKLKSAFDGSCYVSCLISNMVFCVPIHWPQLCKGTESCGFAPEISQIELVCTAVPKEIIWTLLFVVRYKKKKAQLGSLGKPTNRHWCLPWTLISVQA